MEIIDYKVIGNGNTYAELNVYVPKLDMEINRCKEFRMVKDGKERRWFSLPGYYDKEKSLWIPFLKFRTPMNETKFLDTLKDAVDAFIAARPEMETEPMDFMSSEMEMPF